MTSSRPAPVSGGLPYVLGAHLVWGLLPLYLRLVKSVPAFEFVGWRVIFTLPFCVAILAWRRQMADLFGALRDWRVLRLLLASSVMIGANWLIYVWAIQQDHVYAASFGYYITPLVQVLAGTLFLRETLTRLQWAAVGLSGVGVTVLGWDEIGMLGLSLALAFTWSSYGLIRKLTPVASLPGLTVEAIVLLPGAIAIAAWHAATPAGTALSQSPTMAALVICSGLVTAVPLLLFAVATRRMDFTVLGMLQFISPTLVFGLGVTAFGLPLNERQIAAFTIIWAAIGLFVWDLLRRRRRASAA